MTSSDPAAGQTRRRRLPLPDDPAGRRTWAVDANDGIISTAGVVEGFAGAGTSGATLVAAAIASMVSGGAALAAAKYNEAAAERDAERATIAEEERQLRAAPDAELAELTSLYEERGLSGALARRVAEELTAHDALAAHLDAEHGVRSRFLTNPLTVAAGSGASFASGAAIPLAAVLVADQGYDGLFTFVAVLLSLCVTSFLASRVDGVSTARTVVRTVSIAAITMTITYFGGTLFQL